MSFELKFFMCLRVSIWGFRNRVWLSVCLSPEKRNHPSFVNISPTEVFVTSIERSSRVLQHGNPKIWFYFHKRSKLKLDLYFDMLKCWNHLSFVNISPTVVIDSLIHQWKGLHEYLLQHGNPKIWFSFQKRPKYNFGLCRSAKNALLSIS